MGGSAPSPPKPPPVMAPEPDLDELARKRASLNDRRRGGQSLRIEANDAPATTTGLRIPQA